MKIRLASNLMFDSIVDGQGLRIVVWTQGCLFNCYKCHNPNTHDVNGGELYDIDELIKRIVEYPLKDGVTFSGGDPFYQLDEIEYMIKKLKEHHINVWAYTGDTYEHMIDQNNPFRDKNLDVLSNIDILVDGPFVFTLADMSLQFRGSSNQRIIDVQKSLKENKTIIADI